MPKKVSSRKSAAPVAASATTAAEPAITVAQIEECEESAMASTSNVNEIATLLEYLKSTNTTALLAKTCGALDRIFSKYQDSGVLNLSGTGAAADDKDQIEAEIETMMERQGKKSRSDGEWKKVEKTLIARRQFRAFLLDKFSSYMNQLLALLDSGEKALQRIVFDTLMKWVRIEVQAILSEKEGSSGSITPVEKITHRLGNGLLYYTMLYTVCTTPGTSIALLKHVRDSYLQCYVDVRLFALKALTNIARNLDKYVSTARVSGQKRKAGDRDASSAAAIVLQSPVIDLSDSGEHSITQNIFDLLEKVHPHQNAESETPVTFLVDAPESEEESVNTVTSVDVWNRSCSATGHKKAFTDCWIGLMSRRFSVEVYRRILLCMHRHILPNLLHPVRVVDFLTDSYNQGGVISLLALHGLFILITEYNLDYPEFYEKLYQLLEPRIFHVKYRARFFQLSYLFLTSTYVPAYMIAAFLKRFARLSLTAPPAGQLFVITITYNLLKRHPHCMPMIHRAPLEDDEDEDSDSDRGMDVESASEEDGEAENSGEEVDNLLSDDEDTSRRQPATATAVTTGGTSGIKTRPLKRVRELYEAARRAAEAEEEDEEEKKVESESEAESEVEDVEEEEQETSASDGEGSESESETEGMAGEDAEMDEDDYIQRACEDVDAFSMDEMDPKKCDAQYSSLWELELLLSHYSPAISTLIKSLRQEFRQHFEYDMERFAKYTYPQLVADECQRKAKNEDGSVPLAIEPPKCLLDTSSKTFSMFE